MTVILVPLPKRIEELNFDEKYKGKIIKYVNKLQQYGLSVRHIWPTMLEHDIDLVVDSCTGALLIGGDDFDSSLFGQEPHPSTVPDEPGRDVMELSILKKIFERKIPFVGICRGMQAMAISRGGTLFQHIPDITNEWHGEGNHSKVQQDVFHEVDILPDSRISSLVGKNKIIVNSFHHQAVRVPGEGLKIVGKSPGGVAELMEAVDPEHFCFGIQSHPEKLDNSDLEIIFRKFAEAVKPVSEKSILVKTTSV